nr:S-protein homolog 21-like [Ziziphus jujuba var. spinosa]
MTKMKTWSFSLVLVLIASSLFITISGATTVHILNSMPKNSGQVDIHCKSKNNDLGSRVLEEGKDYNWPVEENAVYFCEAVRLPRNIASWHAFEPERDVGHDSVFWLVKEEGFFRSWDNSTWVQEGTWETG